MKKLYFLVVVLLAFTSVKGQVIDFPDANFKAKLFYNGIAKNLNGQFFLIDANQNGEIEYSEALNVSYLDLEDDYNSFDNFSDFTGLSYFQNLKYLSINSVSITAIDLTMLTNLQEVVVKSQFDYVGMALNSLNVTGLTNLKSLVVYNAPLLASLDLSGLVSLEVFALHFADIMTGTLDFQQNTNLNTVFIARAPNLNIDLSGCSGVTEITIVEGISSVDLAGCTSIIQASFEESGLTSLNIDDLINLESLNLRSNSISEINLNNNTALIIIDCAYNQLTSLETSNNSLLANIRCHDNLLTSLNTSANPEISWIICYNNLLTELDLSNNPEISSIDASNNQLINIDFTGCTELSNFLLNDNLFTTFDIASIPKPVTLNLANNQLVSVNIKNGYQDYVELDGNPNLEYLCADDLDSYISNELPDTVEINSYCSFTPGGNYYTINGTNTLDSNNNGCDTSDISLPNLKFNITNGTQTGSLISNASGEYSIPVSAGTHTITPVLENPSFFTISPSTVNVTFPNQASPSTQNFCVTPVGFHWDIDVNIIAVTPAVPGFDAQYKIIYRNIGNVSITSGSISLNYNDEVLDLILANPDTEVLPAGSLFWTFTNLQPFETRTINLSFNLNSPMETPALNGDDVLTFEASSSIGTGFDENPSDNVMLLNQIVVNSFDPNDKTCLEGTAITPDMIGKYVHYMIRFENTGTFAAQNIVVKDMIDTTKFDVSSLIALSGSHPYVTRITGNKVEFIFEGINLPFDDANNDGYVVFKIKTLPTLALGDSFSNTASIYFDFNHPIVTEPAVTTFAVLGTEDFVFNNYFTIYPNPTNGILNITSKQAIELQSISIYNVLGQMVVSVPNAKGVSTVDVSSLSTGNYFIKVVSDKGTSNAKFIKQ